MTKKQPGSNKRRSRTPERGQYGNKRGKSEQQKQRARLQDHRAQAALAKTRAEREALEARMRGEAKEFRHEFISDTLDTIEEVREANPTIDIEHVDLEALHEQELLDLRIAIEKRAFWSLGEAILMVTRGYTVKHVVKYTGWPEELIRNSSYVGDDAR